MMLGTIPIGQLVGGLIETALLFAGGAYLLWIWPRVIRHRAELTLVRGPGLSAIPLARNGRA